ncbi:conserved Plasmodium protein, unknown function [Plasmodium gallinaceum]|uniref:ER membrane protein complex subunit 7 beta-sandwich domain-containing protein n=1 Tax=Plasmodium gallinaceum TaxID=5849 RepID=A0A1J1H2D7_PLAGA|nr:conserved Plasmodium protein, unknown function [Plasmodium gallinaceum]CRG97494.1 conserved Plasmodium protein, unknown function [Plasmodium gallinaceum]
MYKIINENLKFLMTIFVITFICLNLKLSKCKEEYIDLKNNYIEGIIKANSDILLNCTVYLDSENYTKPKNNGKFVFTNVNEGVYNLFVSHPYLEFNRFHVEVKQKMTKNNYKMYIVQAYELLLPFEKNNLMSSNIIFEVKNFYEFLIPKKNFSIFKLLKSPLFLTFLFFLILLCLLPQMQKISESANEENYSQVTYKSDFLESVK